MENETWTLTNLPPGRKALDCTWVIRVKTDAEGKLERRKTRLVIKGFQQREEINFQEVFAPVAKAATLRVLLAAAAVCGWKVEQMDLKKTFLYGKALGPVGYYLGLHVGIAKLTSRRWRLSTCRHAARRPPCQGRRRPLLRRPLGRPAQRRGAEPGGAESKGAESMGAEPRGTASSGGLAAGDSTAGGTGGAGATSLGGVGFPAGAGGPGGAGAAGPGGARTKGIGAAGLVELEALEPEELELKAPALAVLELEELKLGTLELEVLALGVMRLVVLVLEALYSGARFSFHRRLCRHLPRQVLSLPSSTTESTTSPMQPQLQPKSPLPTPSPYAKQIESFTEGREPESQPALLVCAVRIGRRVPRSRPPPIPGTHVMAIHPFSVPLRVPLPPPPESSLPAVPDPESDLACAASPNCLAAAVPHLVAMLLDPEGDSDAPDIPTPRSYAEAITSPYSSQQETAMDTEMAS
ncbi:unnamed protein product [Closterium sp. NIES-53]